MQSRLRDLTQTDSSEISDVLANLFIEEGWRHCAYWHPHWPFYRQTWTYSLAGPLNTITSKQLVAGADNVAEVALPATPNSIVGIFDATNDRKLEFVPYDSFMDLALLHPDTTGDPRRWTIEQGQFKDETITNIGWAVAFTIRLWPTPPSGDTYNLEFYGFREPISFVDTNDGYGSGTVPGGYYSTTAATAIPDMPIPFHEAILWYAVGQAFAYLDEGDKTVFYSAKADNILRQQEAVWFRLPPSDQPIVMGSDGLGFATRRRHRLPYQWEI